MSATCREFMKTIVAETSLKTNILLLLQLLLTFFSNILQIFSGNILQIFSSNNLQIEYQMLVLAHTELRKYEFTFSSHILQT